MMEAVVNKNKEKNTKQDEDWSSFREEHENRYESDESDKEEETDEDENDYDDTDDDSCDHDDNDDEQEDRREEHQKQHNNTSLTRRFGPSLAIQNAIDAAIAARSAQQETGSGQLPPRLAPTPTTCSSAAKNYEQLNHTADVQLHAWGDSAEETLGQVILAMFDFMTCLALVEPRQEWEMAVVQGHDVESCIFQTLHEWLCHFHETGLVPRRVEIIEWNRQSGMVKSRGWGEPFDRTKHSQEGTEIKAITFGNLKFKDEGDRVDIWVTVDI